MALGDTILILLCAHPHDGDLILALYVHRSDDLPSLSSGLPTIARFVAINLKSVLYVDEGGVEKVNHEVLCSLSVNALKEIFSLMKDTCWQSERMKLELIQIWMEHVGVASWLTFTAPMPDITVTSSPCNTGFQ